MGAQFERLYPADTETAKDVLNAIHEEPGMTTGELAKKLSISPDYASTQCHALVRHGYAHAIKTRDGKTNICRFFPGSAKPGCVFNFQTASIFHAASEIHRRQTV